LPSASPSGRDERLSPAIPSHQLIAAADPERSTSNLIGNFSDFEDLFEQLAQPHVIELGKPLPRDKHLPRERAGSCPATHNRRLAGEELD
jgi:hypothetical protein